MPKFMCNDIIKKFLVIINIIGCQVYACEDPHRIAAQWVQDCPLVIEIGGAGKPMSRYIDNASEVIVVDPKMRSSQYEGVTHIGKGFDDCTLDDFHIDERPYAVIMLGLSLQGVSESGWDQLYDLIDNSKKTVIEYSAQFAMAKRQLKTIKKSTKKQVVEQKEFNAKMQSLPKKSFKKHKRGKKSRPKYSRSNTQRAMILLTN